MSAGERGAATRAQRADLGVDAALAGTVACAEAGVGTAQRERGVGAGEVLDAGVGAAEEDGAHGRCLSVVGSGVAKRNRPGVGGDSRPVPPHRRAGRRDCRAVKIAVPMATPIRVEIM